MNPFMMATYFEEQVGIKFEVGPEIKEMPDLLGTITVLAGEGLINDGLFDRPQFQIALRGTQNRYADVEGFAKQVDDLIVFGDYPHELWGGYVISAYRSGGAPAPQLALDQGRRVIFVCTYTAQEAID
jgi:hypothetical protein